MCAVLTIIGGALLALGSFMPWVTAVDFSNGVDTWSFSGLDGVRDGLFILPIGIGAVCIGVTRLVVSTHPYFQRLPLALGVLAAAISIYDLVDINERLADMNTSTTNGAVSQGPGLYAVIVGAVVTAIGGLVVTGPAPKPGILGSLAVAFRSLNHRRAAWVAGGLLVVVLFPLSWQYPAVIGVEAGAALVSIMAYLRYRPVPGVTLRAIVAWLLILFVPQLVVFANTHVRDCDASETLAVAAPGSKDARQVLAELSDPIKNVRFVESYTAENDQNELLGCRAHAYTSKVNFSDTSINEAELTGYEPDDYQRGGAVEVFANEADAAARYHHLQTIVRPSDADLEEQDFLNGRILLRLSTHLASTQVARYQEALKRIGQ